MKKKNNFVKESLSFEDFEQEIAQRLTPDTALDELVNERLSGEKESRQKERELKRPRKSGLKGRPFKPIFL